MEQEKSTRFSLDELARQLAELRGDDVAPRGTSLADKIRSAFS